MGRRFVDLALALMLVAGLSACSKCGDWQELNVPKLPGSCVGDGAR